MFKQMLTLQFSQVYTHPSPSNHGTYTWADDLTNILLGLASLNLSSILMSNKDFHYSENTLACWGKN